MRQNADGDGRLDAQPALALLAFLLAGLALLKVPYSLETQRLYPQHDGGYYTNVARNVRDGHGLTTNISLYHKAYREFPHRTSVYPLWPLLHGTVARALPLGWVGVWLPTLLYFCTLGFAYLWGQRLLPGPLLGVVPWLGAGHVLVLMLGLHLPFFEFTSLPYTEGLAYALLFAALWRTWPAWARPKTARGLELGAWLGVLFLARGQFLVVAGAALGALLLALVLVEPRRDRLGMLLGATATFGTIAAAYRLYLSTFVANPGWSSLVRFDRNRASDLLSSIPVLAPTDGIVAFLADRASGFVVAFAPRGEYSYAAAYHVFQYAVVLATPLLLLEGARRLAGGERRATLAWLRSPSSPAWIFLALLAAGGFLSIHSIHKVYAREWNFATRQALTCLFLFFPALLYLLRCRWRLVSVAGLALTLAGGALGATRAAATVARVEQADPGVPGRRPWKPGLARWLLERQQEHGELTVALSYPWPQRLALTTPGVNYHWVYWGTTRKDVETMFRVLGVRYLLWERDSRPKGAFLVPKAEFVARFEEIHRNLDGFRVFVLREPAPSD